MTKEEAIEVYNGLINTKIKEAFEFFAPELRESEDERHRKWILEYLYDGLRKADEQFKGQFNAAIAYLEKQKEQEHPCDSAQFEEGFKTGYELGLRKKEEQKPAEWSDEDEKTRRNLMSLLVNMRGNRITEGTYQKYYPWLKDLHPSWKPSEEQMGALEKVRTIFHHYHLWDEINPILYDYEELMRDLKKL